MLGTRVPFFARSGQIPLITIVIFSCGLSFWLTLRFCSNLAPQHALLELFAIGGTWEIAKLTFGTIGAQRLGGGGGPSKMSGYALVAVSSVLALGSIGASMAFLMQTDQRLSDDVRRASLRSLHASKAYERDAAGLVALDGEIDELMAQAKGYRTQGLITQGLRTMDRLQPLRDQRNALAQALSARDDEIRDGGAVDLGSHIFGNATVWRTAAQVMLAVMLEVISMIAMSLLCGTSAKQAEAEAEDPGSSKKGVRLKVATPTTNASGTTSLNGDASGAFLHPIDGVAFPSVALDARLQQMPSCVASLDEDAKDASGKPTLLHRIDDAASPRITMHAGLHHLETDASTRTTCAARPMFEGRHAVRMQTLYWRASTMLRTAQVRPRYRDLQQALGVSQKAVQRCLRRLVAEGVLCRQGARYALASPFDMDGGAA